MTEPLLSGFSHEVARYIAAALAPRAERSVVVFDFDNTCILGDVGELFACWLVDTVGYRYDLQEFWDLIEPSDGRDDIRALVDELSELPDDAEARREVFGRYRAEMQAVYPRKLLREGKRVVYEWAVKLHVGLTPELMTEWSRACCLTEWSTPVHQEIFETRDGGEFSVWRGIRRVRAIREVMEFAQQQGHEVWVVSASNQWTVRAAASLMFGIPAQRVLGNVLEVEAGELTSRTIPPVTYREGKVEKIEAEIGVRPTLVFGDSDTDLDMMSWADAAVLIDHGNAEAQAAAVKHGWAVQPQSDLEMEAAP